MQIVVFDPMFGWRNVARFRVGIARPDNARVDKFIDLARRHKPFRVFEFHFDFITGHDVGHIHLKDIGALLLQQ